MANLFDELKKSVGGEVKSLGKDVKALPAALEIMSGINNPRAVAGGIGGGKSPSASKTPDIYDQIANYTGTNRSNAGHLLAEYQRQYGNPTAFGGTYTGSNLTALEKWLRTQMPGSQSSTTPADPLHAQAFFSQVVAPYLQHIASSNNDYIANAQKTEAEVAKEFPVRDKTMQAILNQGNARSATAETELNNTLASQAAAGPFLDQILTQLQASRQQQQNLWLNGIPNFTGAATSPFDWLNTATPSTSTGIGSTLAGLIQQPTTTPTP